MSKLPKVTVKLNDEVPESFELIAASILKISELGEAVRKTALNERAILLLIRDATNVPMGDIKLVLDALPLLKRKYCK